ncbi:MAG TPA: DUF4912 domain-containing protein [Candidatus Omnitrophica bacterium]|nr:DUF4912 domain-containing protein [Candidatus Omnitrophota bacterium]
MKKNTKKISLKTKTSLREKKRKVLSKKTTRPVKKRKAKKTIIPKTSSLLSLKEKKEGFSPLASVQVQKQSQASLPYRYKDNRIVLMVRDPWWLHTYWDISKDKVNQLISSLSLLQQENLKWVLRVHDVTDTRSLTSSHSYFDIDINFEAGNWYINVNQPERHWCVEIGLKNIRGEFFPLLCSNIVKTPFFGISPVLDEEWALPEEEYYKILGGFDLGKSSLERKKKFDEFFKQEISSPLASWGFSGPPSKKILKDKFFLEVATEIILYGRTDPDAEVEVEGKKVNLRRDGTFSLRYALNKGDFKFEVVATQKNKKQKIKKLIGVKRY